MAAGAGPLLLDVLGLSALLVQLSPWSTWIAAALSAIALVAMVALQLWSARSPARALREFGDDVTVRLLLVATAAAAAVERWGTAPLLIGPAVLGGLVVVEAVLRRIQQRARPYVARMSGVRSRPPARLDTRTVVVVNTVALVGLLLAAYLGRQGPLLPLQFLVLAWLAICASIAAVVGVDAARRIMDRRRFEARLPGLLGDQLRPVFAVHWEAPPGTAYQIAMWLPYLERIGLPYFILVRTETNFRDVLALGDGVTTAPILLRRNIGDLDAVITPTLKTIFYVNTATKNAHTIRYAQLTHIQLNHGDSDKAPSYNPVFRMFDKDFVAGQAAIDRFAAHGVSMPSGIFSIVGRPQVENLQVASSPIGRVENPTVLYAPTWAGFYADSNYSSLHVGPAIVEALLARGCTVIFRPHPYSRRTPFYREQCAKIIAALADRATPETPHLSGPVAEQELSVFDCFDRSDVMVSDVSSVVGDYLYTEKPFAMLAVSTAPSEFAAEFPVAVAAYLADARPGTTPAPGGVLGGVLDDLLGADPLAATRKALKTYYLGDIPAERYAERFLDEARKYLS